MRNDLVAVVGLVTVGVFTLGGCAKPQESMVATPPAPAEATVVSQGASTLPVSMNEVMVALTDRSAEPFWSASQQPPKDQQGWDELEYNAMQIALSGVVISYPGTGAADAGWVGQQQWQDYAKQLTAVGVRALGAARTRDQAAINLAGDDLVLICEDCHAKFKPDIPTQGILMRSEYYRPK